MRRLILSFYVSIDGKSIDETNGLREVMTSIDDPHQESDYVAQLWEAGAFLMGSRSYEAMAGFWPTSDHPSAAAMNSIPKIVFSQRKLAVDGWPETRVASGPLVDEVAALKAEDGKDLFSIGGNSFQSGLIAAGLVDEYRLWILPAAVGRGAALFPGLASPLALRPVATTVYAGGIIELRYVPSTT